MNTIQKNIAALILVFSLFTMHTPRSEAYETGIHYYLTYIIANVCGLGADGETAALADYSVDMFPDTDAGAHFDEWLDPSKEGTRKVFHFPVANGPGHQVVRGSAEAWQTISIATDEANTANVNPITLGIGLHTLQDSYAHEGYGPLLGHWTQAPDLPKNDVDKLVEAGQSTWTAMDSWSLKIFGHGCVAPYASLADKIKVWAALDLNSDDEIKGVWSGIASTIAGKAVSPDGLYEVPAFQTAFESTAAHVRTLKEAE